MRLFASGDVMKIGYARISAAEQDEVQQIEVLEAAGCEKIFLDKVSGKDTNRPQLKEMLDFASEGDTIIIKELSRLGLSVRDLTNISASLVDKGINLVVLRENIDTSNALGRMFFNIMSCITEFEREIIRERTAEGIRIAKAQGKYKGRKPKVVPHSDILKEVNNGVSVTYICKKYKISPNVFYKHFKRGADGIYRVEISYPKPPSIS